MKRFTYQRGKKQLFRLQVQVTGPGQRLDQYLADEIEGLSRTEARKLIDVGGVHVLGRRVRSCSRPVQKNDAIEVHVDGLALEPFRLSQEHILFRDKYIIVLNKPAGVDTQPTPARYKGTLYDALLTLLGPAPSGRRKPELGMIQRLDRGTSGLMVFSIHQRAHPGLSQIFLEHQVEKRYLALVEDAPVPAEAEIRSQLARSRRLNKVVSVTHGGKDAITRYRTLLAAEKGALLDVEILTGRSHQIRAHLSEAGAPLLGDTLYGGARTWQDLTLARPMLHASRLAFTHPVTREGLAFTAPLPPDMQGIRDQLEGTHLLLDKRDEE